MLALGLAGAMLCLGVILRGSVPFLRKMLVPASVIAGILGFILINVLLNIDATAESVDTDTYSTLVNNLFTISFIAIGLKGTSGKGQSGKIVKNSFSLGMFWNFLYALTPILCVLILIVIGGSFDMDTIYGLLIQFGFCQGPGQAASFGLIFEQYGWENASSVGITFAAVGFLVAFLVGIPIAKYGIKHKRVNYLSEIEKSTERGFFKKGESSESLGKETTHSGNIDTVAMHFAIIGVTYLVALGIAYLFSFLPSFFGTAMSSMMFFNGLIAAYIVRFIINKLKIDYILDSTFLTKITNLTTDFLVVCSFMAIAWSTIAAWIVPILVECVVVAAVTFVAVWFIVPRLCPEDPFERLLGMWGSATGTIPSGVSLIRIVDPQLKSTAASELGLMNLPMVASTPVYYIALAIAAGSLSMTTGLLYLAGLAVIYFIVMVVIVKIPTKKKKTQE